MGRDGGEVWRGTEACGTRAEGAFGKQLSSPWPRRPTPSNARPLTIFISSCRSFSARTLILAGSAARWRRSPRESALAADSAPTLPGSTHLSVRGPKHSSQRRRASVKPVMAARWVGAGVGVGLGGRWRDRREENLSMQVGLACRSGWNGPRQTPRQHRRASVQPPNAGLPLASWPPCAPPAGRPLASRLRGRPRGAGSLVCDPPGVAQVAQRQRGRPRRPPHPLQPFHSARSCVIRDMCPSLTISLRSSCSVSPVTYAMPAFLLT